MLLLCLPIWSQNSSKAFIISGNVKVDQGIVEGFNVEITKDGTLERTESVNRAGNLQLSLS